MNAPTCTAQGLRVTWAKVEGAVKYEVYRFIGAGTPTWKKVATVDATDDALQVYNESVKASESGKWYAYTVRAIASDTTKGAQPGGRSVRYRAPVQTTKVENTASGVKVTFNTVDAGYTYMLYRSTKNANGTWSAYEKIDYKCYVYNEASRSKTITDTTAKAGQAYRYYVRCMSKDLAVPLSSFKNYKEIQYKKP